MQNALNREEVQRATLRLLLLVAASLVLPAWWYLANADDLRLPLLSICIALTVALYAIGRILPGHLQSAKAAFLATSLAAILAARFLAGVPQASYLLVLPILALAALSRPQASVLLAFALSLLLWLAAPAEAALPVAVLLGTALGLWAMLRHLHELLDWSLQRSLDATILAEQLRDQRGKLNRTIKDLDASYQLLQQTNRELATARREADMLRDMRSRFATNLSHELRTPLNIILGFAQLIYLNSDLYGYRRWSDELRRDLGQIQRNASYLSELVDDIVDLARVDALAMPIRRESTQLCRLIEEAVSTVHSLALGKGLELVVRCLDGLPELSVDPVRIRQVLFNLITNAIRYTERGSITVEVARLDDEVVTLVRDTGVGIPPDQLETIFDEFYQVGRPKETADAGKGLGLAIAKRFVQLHGGRIWAESEIDKGSTFAFSLPLGDKRTSRLRQPSSLPVLAARTRPTVLVLGDDGTASGYLRRRFPAYEFAAVGEVSALPEIADRTRPSAVIVNRPVGEGEGEEAHAVVSYLGQTIPVMECSLPSATWLSGEERFTAVLTKPISQESLLATLADVLPGRDTASVLLVDDDRGFVQLVSRMLQAAPGAPYRVLTAYNGEEALRRLRRFRPDAVLADLVMPGMSGFDLLLAVRGQPELADLPVVAVTAATPGEDKLSATGTTFSVMRGGAFQPGELLRLISAGLELSDGAALTGGGSGEA